MGANITKTTRDLVIEIHKELKGKTPVSIKELEEAIQKSMVAFEKFVAYEEEIHDLRQDIKKLKRTMNFELRLKENQVISYAKWLLILINTGLLMWIIITMQ